MRKIITVGLVFLVVFVLFTTVQRHREKVAQTSADLDSEQVNFTVRTPENIAVVDSALLVFHGGYGDSGNAEAQTNFTELGRRYGFMVVYPDSGDGHWDDHRFIDDENDGDVKTIEVFIDRLRAEYGIKKVYVTGISNGGTFVYRLACEIPEKIDGFAPVAANLPVRGENECVPKTARPMIVQQGTSDPLMKYEGGELPAGEGGWHAFC